MEHSWKKLYNPTDPFYEYFMTIDSLIRPNPGSACYTQWITDHITDINKFYDARRKKETKYAFTLTSGRADVTDDEMRLAANKILTQTTCPVVHGAAYLEHHESGKPHVHGWYQLKDGTKIWEKVWKRYWKDWDSKIKNKNSPGHKGGYHAVMASDKYKDYASAEEDLIYQL